MITHPMKPGTYRVSSGYGPRWGTFHAGLDFAAPVGTPIYAAADGVVVEGRERYNVAGFGSWIWLDCQDSAGRDFIYGHVKHDGILVKAGDRVRAGQQIGVVGNEGESTGPHLHFEVWGPPGRLGGVHEDPARYLGRANAPQGAGDTSENLGNTIFGVDVSEHQDGMSLTQAKREGIDFAIIRTTDGTHKDRCYRSHLKDAEGAGLLTAAYHYLRNPSEGTTVVQQVQASLEVMGNEKRPMWIDVETNAGLHVDHIRECKREFERRGVHVVGVYSYVPYWEGRVAPHEPDSHEFGAFWVAAYGVNPRGRPRSIYPGDQHRQWNYPLGNQKPALWQFGSNALVAGYSVDINAFRGTRAELGALFTGKQKQEEDDMSNLYSQITTFISGYLGPQIDALQDVWTQLRGPKGKGWPQLGQNDQGQNLTLVDAVAALRQDIARIEKKLEGK
ncbi:peptidoglycan DD-metalloendopeptidase family protein [Corynebacterium singulare]|uniref:peptidoglycan DD-metalloendopeptidase family protein n=1 Tax=Corynebacterium singulare TaxID=161899 RepID=UPI0011A6160B|nr:peptidoglycan DD-metalloendopeptidase family protein [Corynebacterium singulare]